MVTLSGPKRWDAVSPVFPAVLHAYTSLYCPRTYMVHIWRGNQRGEGVFVSSVSATGITTMAMTVALFPEHIIL